MVSSSTKVCVQLFSSYFINPFFFKNGLGASAIAPSAWNISLDTNIYIYIYTHTHTVGYAIMNTCYNEQFLSIKSGCYNEHRCYKESGGILSPDVARACAWHVRL